MRGDQAADAMLIDSHCHLDFPELAGQTLTRYSR